MRLAAEAGLEGRVAGHVGAERLHGDRTAEPGVMGKVDLGHAAASQDAAELVPAAEATRLFHISDPLPHRVVRM
ncbi:hypothetical protein GCM10010440_03490 [Kitasatospora cinereorecta]